MENPPTPTATVKPLQMEETDQIKDLPNISRPTPVGTSRLPRPVFTPKHTNVAKIVEREEKKDEVFVEEDESRATKRKSSTELTNSDPVKPPKRSKEAPPPPPPPSKATLSKPGASRGGLARPPIRGSRATSGTASSVNKALTKSSVPAPAAKSASSNGSLPTTSNFSFRANASSASGSSAAQSRPPIKGTTGPAARGVGSRPGSGNDRKVIEQMEALQAQLQDHEDQLNSMKEQKGTLNNQLAERSGDLEASERALLNVRKDLREKEAALEDEKRRGAAALEAERKKIKELEERLQEELDGSQRECRKLKSKVSNLEDELDNYEVTVGNQKTEITKLKNEVTQLRSDCGDNAGELERRQIRINECEAQIEKLVEKGDWHEAERRRLHNTIQELKGNIRVFCRMRPFLPSELKAGDTESSHVSFDENDSTKIVVNDTNANTPALPFKFDLVFKQDASQSLIFGELSQLVQSALDGYSVCVFAYGQTGSGKTYTMEGPDNYDDESMGMIPRSVQQIFESAKKMQDKGWRFEFKASMLEIYNETVNDLLYEGKPENAPKHEIKLVKEGSKEVHVTNLIVKDVSEPRDIRNLMDVAHGNRKRAATKCNERSSRSHFVCNIKITSRNDRTNETLLGSLDLVDLAGSERIKESGSTGVQAKEAFKINGSLKTLGDVIEAIKKNQKHIPFRDSQLTKLLQNNLVGSSKTLMFVNISPRPEHANETVNSLRFATKANNTNIGTASQKTK